MKKILLIILMNISFLSYGDEIKEYKPVYGEYKDTKKIEKIFPYNVKGMTDSEKESKSRSLKDGASLQNIYFAPEIFDYLLHNNNDLKLITEKVTNGVEEFVKNRKIQGSLLLKLDIFISKDKPYSIKDNYKKEITKEDEKIIKESQEIFNKNTDCVDKVCSLIMFSEYKYFDKQNKEKSIDLSKLNINSNLTLKVSNPKFNDTHFSIYLLYGLNGTITKKDLVNKIIDDMEK
jgi:hypothetical protein